MKSLLFTAGLLFGIFSLHAQSTDLTFRVDMSEFGGTIDASGMHLAGNFPTDTWTPAARPMTDEGDGIWSYTETLEAGYALEYKFVLGNDWSFGDEGMGGQPCAAPGTTNRALTVPAEETVLPAVCWNSCNPCDFQAATSEITFQVDMSLETIDFENGGVSLAGSFNGFGKEPMVDQGDGLYSVTLSLEQGTVIQYKFRNGDGFESPSGACAAGDFGNRLLEIPTADFTLAPVCYSSCEACVAPGDDFNVTFRTDASQIEADSAGLYIAGTFNGFSPEPMTDEGDGIWSATYEVSEGSTVLWKFLNGETFDGAESVPGACGQDDGFGGNNRDLIGPSEDTVLDVVCFGSCEACTEPGILYDVTFRVDASEIEADEAGIFIAGTFNGFTPTAMNDDGAGLYSFTAAVEEGSEVLWKYLNGDSFDGAESVPEECGSDDGFGGFNRVLTGPAEDTVLDVVCFGSCSAECISTECLADGGTLTALSPVSVCVGTGEPQGVNIQLSGAVGQFGRYGLLDTDNNVLDVRAGNANFNLDVYPPGQYRIRHLRYEADVDAAQLASLTNASQLAGVEGCWASSNTVNVFLSTEPEGGTLTATSPTTVCAASGSQTVITTELTGASGFGSRFFLVNLSAPGNPVLANNSSGDFNLNAYGPGTYQVRHLSYQQGVSLTGIESAADLKGCFDISNGVNVSIVNCGAALSSSPNPTAAQSYVTFSNPGGEYTTLEVYDMSGRMVERIFSQVTVPGQEYRLEFDGAGLPNGVYLYRLTTESETITDKFMIAR